MGLFRPYEQGSGRKQETKPAATKASTATEPVEATDAAEAPQDAKQPTTVHRQPAKKGRPTPTRAEAEAARRERLHPTLSPKEQRKAERAAERERRIARMEALEKSPQRQIARDYIDSRFSLVSWILPIMLVIMAVQIAFPRNYMVLKWSSILMMVAFVYYVGAIYLSSRGLRKELVAHGHRPERGLNMYMMNRMMTMRRMRRPAPRVGRGDKF